MKCLKRATCFGLDTRHTWQTTPQKQKYQQKNKSNLNWLSKLIKKEVGDKLSDSIFSGNEKVVNKINVRKKMAKKMCKKQLGTESLCPPPFSNGEGGHSLIAQISHICL